MSPRSIIQREREVCCEAKLDNDTVPFDENRGPMNCARHMVDGRWTHSDKKRLASRQAEGRGRPRGSETLLSTCGGNWRTNRVFRVRANLSCIVPSLNLSRRRCFLRCSTSRLGGPLVKQGPKNRPLELAPAGVEPRSSPAPFSGEPLFEGRKVNGVGHVIAVLCARHQGYCSLTKYSDVSLMYMYIYILERLAVET